MRTLYSNIKDGKKGPGPKGFSSQQQQQVAAKASEAIHPNSNGSSSTSTATKTTSFNVSRGRDKPIALASCASEKFELPESFLREYKARKAPFGFNGLGELVSIVSVSA